LDQDRQCLTSSTASSRKDQSPTKAESSSRQVRHHSNKLTAGFQSKELIIQAGLTLGDVDQYATIDVTIDGADE
jgi:ribose 5-phosphate isomerase